MLLNNEWANQEVKEEIKKYMETNEKKDTMSKIVGVHQKLL